MSHQVPVTISSESNSPIAVTITSASESAQTISSDQNPDVALVSEIITVPEEEDDQRSDTIQHVDSSSDDEGLEVLEAEVATARARREEQEALERLAKARRARGSNSSALSVRTVRSSHSVRSVISSEPLQIPANGGRDMKGNIVDPTGNTVDPHVRHLPEPQAPPAPTGLAAQPLTAAPHVPELPTAAAKTSWREWFATGDQRVSVQDRIALLERAPTRSEPASDHGDVVQRFLLEEHDLGLQSAQMRIQELESMIKRQGSRTSFESVLSR